MKPTGGRSPPEGARVGYAPQNVHTARKVLQVPLAIYDASKTRRLVAPESMQQRSDLENYSSAEV